MKHRRLAGGLLTALAFAVIGAPQAGAAQVDYFLKLDTIEGESTATGHAGEIVVDSWSWGLKNSGSPTGGGGGAGKVNVQDFSFTKKMDRSSPLLMLAVAQGQRFRCATLTARKGRDQDDFLVITFRDLLISSYQTGGSAGDAVPTDSFSLNFTRIRFEHRSRTRAGVPQHTDVSWDFSANDQFSTSSTC